MIALQTGATRTASRLFRVLRFRVIIARSPVWQMLIAAIPCPAVVRNSSLTDRLHLAHIFMIAE